MPRSPRAEDLYALRVPTDVRISPDGSRVAFVVKEPSPDKHEYRSAVWLAPAAGSSPPRKITLGSKHDNAPRWSPDGRTLAFLSDRGHVLRSGGGADEPRDPQRQAGKSSDDATQVWLLPMDGGEAAQLTRLPASVGELVWSPDGKRLCVTSWATSTTKPRRTREPGTPPDGDARLIDRLQYMANGDGYTLDKAPKLWVIDVADGSAKRITAGPVSDEQRAWSPDGKRIAFV